MAVFFLLWLEGGLLENSNELVKIRFLSNANPSSTLC